MTVIEIIIMIYAVAWIVCLPGIAACILSNKIGRQEEKRNICDMEGKELDSVGWHEEPEIEILSHPKPLEVEICE